jgi:hypothetical protein
MKRRALASAWVIGLAVACGTTSHIYPGNLFDRARGCLDPVSSVDVVTGADPGSGCPVTCLVSTTADAGVYTLYVSNECAPFPPFYDTSGKDPDCARAIAAFTLGPQCLSDGGVSGGPPDAGADAGTPDADAATTDAGSD